MAKLTPKQKLFVKEYIIDFNATRAAKAAKYSEKTARQMGCELLTKPSIQQEIAKYSKKKLNEADITVQEVLSKIKAHLETDITDVAKIEMVEGVRKDKEGNITGTYEYQNVALKNTDEMSEQAISSIKSVGYDSHGRIKIEMYDKQKAIEQAGKYLSMFTDKVELEVSKMPQIEIVRNK